jgi:hypothetical protein
MAFARRLLFLAALACLLCLPPLTCVLAPRLVAWAAPEAPADPFVEEMEGLDREYSQAAGAAPDDATRDELRRLRNERAREVYRRHGRRWHGVSGTPSSGLNEAAGRQGPG